MIASSRPLRFLALVVGGWTVLRIALLWPSVRPIPTLMAKTVADVASPISTRLPDQRVLVTMPAALRPFPHQPVTPRAVTRHVITASAGPRIAEPASVTPTLSAFGEPGIGPIGSPLISYPARVASRLRVSAWAIVRDGHAAAPFSPQLGGSQAGIRATYALGDSRRLAIAARVSSALGTRQREGAIGIDWQPTTLPIHLIVEQRIGIARTRGGPSVGAIAGLDPLPVAAGFRIEAYGQAGAIARNRRVEGYADGAIRLARPLATRGGATLDLGLGAWGGAQRGAGRIDVGPSASASLPVAGRSIRIALDWRQRVAGNARPGSGPALSIGTDF